MGTIAAIKDIIREMKEKKKSVDYEQCYFKAVRMGRLTSLLTIVVSFLFLYVLSLNVVAYRLHRNFNHSLRYIRCVVDDAKVLELDSMWVRMQSKADHGKIKAIIDKHVKSADEKKSGAAHADLQGVAR